MRRLIPFLTALVIAMIPSTALANSVAGWGGDERGVTGIGYEVGGEGGNYIPYQGDPYLTKVKEVYSQVEASFALLTNGEVKGWGFDSGSRLGVQAELNHTPTFETPVTIDLPKKKPERPVEMSSDIVRLENGTVETWGSNDYGQLGDGKKERVVEDQAIGVATPHVLPLHEVVQVASDSSIRTALLANGDLYEWGGYPVERSPTKYETEGRPEKEYPGITEPTLVLEGVKEVAVGGLSSYGGQILALLDDGQVAAWGENKFDQLGIAGVRGVETPTIIPDVSEASKVIAGVYDSGVIIKGHLYDWGDNEEGALGDDDICVPEECYTAEPHELGLGDVGSVAFGSNFGAAVSKGSLYTWGSDAEDQLGFVGTNSGTPVKIAEEAVSVSANGRETGLAVVKAEPPAPLLTLTPGVDSLTLSWVEPNEFGNPWQITCQSKNYTTGIVKVEPQLRTYTCEVPAGEEYTVGIKSKNFAPKRVVGEPLS